MKYLFFLGISVFACTPALAQPEDREITVLGTGGWQLVADSGQSISVMDGDELDDLQTPDLAAALERLPGVTFSRNGGAGGFTGVRVRGAGADQLLVLIDGIRVADVAAPGGGHDFGALAASGMGKIELLRGSNSVVWGSEAIAGVLALSSRRIDGVEASAEYGARDSFDGQIGAGLAGAGYALSINGGYTETDGFSSAASGTERDGFRQWRANGTGSVALAEEFSAVLAGRYADSRVEFDGFSFAPPYGLIDTAEYTDMEEWSGRVGLEYSGRLLHLDAGYAVHSIDRANFNPDFGSEPGFASSGRQERIEMKGRVGERTGLRLDFGAEHEWERFSTTFDARNTANTASGHALVGWTGTTLSLSAGARLDDHSGFGSEWTFGANGAVQFAPGWRARASYGEGFKAPTLYQLYSDYGDRALQPERSRSYDIGMERGTRGNGLHLAVTVFRRDSRNLIDFAACAGDQCLTRPFGLYQNVGRARAQGFEIELGAQVSERFRAQAAYSHVETENRTPGSASAGKALARRPAHAVTVSTDWQTPLAGLELGGDIRMVSGSFDDAGNFTRMDGYALGTLRVRLPVTQAIEIHGRIENVTDERYETAAGYGTAGRSAFVGARARF